MPLTPFVSNLSSQVLIYLVNFMIKSRIKVERPRRTPHSEFSCRPSNYLPTHSFISYSQTIGTGLHLHSKSKYCMHYAFNCRTFHIFYSQKPKAACVVGITFNSLQLKHGYGNYHVKLNTLMSHTIKIQNTKSHWQTPDDRHPNTHVVYV